MNNFETEPTQEPYRQPGMIADVLPRYYEAHGDDLTYEVVRSIVIEGHEVAWMEYKGEVVHDITGQGNEGREFRGRELKCVCEFTEGVGWRQEEDGKTLNLYDAKDCQQKEEAGQMRIHELQSEYEKRGFFDPDNAMYEAIQAIALDLIERSKAGEWLEGNSGASFWGGHYYLQTLAEIAQVSMRDIWQYADRMCSDKKIDLEGAVVQEYFDPPEPAWSEPALVYELDGWKVSAALPNHSKMPQEWKFEVTQPNGEKLEIEIPGEPLMYQPTFGPDAGDVAQAEGRILKIMEQVRGKAAQG